MAIIFRYAHVPREDGTLRKAPYIIVFVKDATGKYIKVAALVDSGADNTVVPKDLAVMLGLKDTAVEGETGGIGGKVKVKRSRLTFEVRGRREKYCLDVPVLVLQEGYSDVPLLLGRRGFFEEFEITFRQNEEKIVLKKISPDMKY